MNGAVAARRVTVDIVKSHFDHLADTELVDMVHRERLDLVVLENLTLSLINITQANIYNTVVHVLGRRREPALVRLNVRAIKTQRERYRTAVQVARGRRLGRVNVGMRIHPNGSNVRVHTRRAYHGTSAQTVVATHRPVSYTHLTLPTNREV